MLRLALVSAVSLLCLLPVGCSPTPAQPDGEGPGEEVPSGSPANPPNDPTGPNDPPDERPALPEGLAEVLEEERDGGAPNDTQEEAQAIDMGSKVQGAISSDSDVDTFQVEASAGDVLRLTVQGAAGADFRPLLLVSDDALAGYERFGFPHRTQWVVDRELYIPESGTYYVAVMDLRHFEGTIEDPSAFSAVDYELTVSKSSLTAWGKALPLDKEAGVVTWGRLVANEVTVGAGEAVRAHAHAGALSPASDLDPILYLVDKNSGQVVAQNHDLDAQDENYDAAFQTPAAAGDYWLVLDHASLVALDDDYYFDPRRDARAHFELDLSVVSVSALPPGDLCAAPATLTAGASLGSQSSLLFGNEIDFGANLSAACELAFGFLAPFEGPDAVYAIEIPAGQTLTVTVTPRDVSFDPMIAIVGTCSDAAASCLAGADDGIDGDAETAAYTNSSSTPLPVTVVVDTWASGGDFTLQATLH